MAQACVTVDEFITLLPEFASFGAASVGQLTVTVDPNAGATITVTQDRQDLPAQFVLTEGVDWTIAAGDSQATAQSIADAFVAQGALQASAVSGVVHVLTSATGYESEYATTDSDPNLDWASARLTRGSDQIAWALSCTCSMINLECWGDKASCGHAYLAAHFMAVEAGGEGGIVNNRKIDTIQEGYGGIPNFDTSDAALASTKWGRLYLALRATLLTPPFVGRRYLARPGGFGFVV